MTRHKKDGEHEKDKRKERAGGGRMRSGNAADGEGSGDPEFFGGAESPTAKASHGDKSAAKGGRIKRRKERKAGGRIVEGKAAHKRLDRADMGHKRRAAGGRMIGSDAHPLTEANRLERPKGDKGTPADNPEDD